MCGYMVVVAVECAGVSRVLASAPQHREALVIRFDVGTPTPVDGLCFRCLTPALAVVDVFRLTDSGVTRVGVMTVCMDCRRGSHAIG